MLNIERKTLKRKLVSRVSFVLADVARRPRSHKRVAAVEFMGPRVSKTNGSKICVLAKHKYLSSLCAAANSGAEPAV